MSGSPAGVLQRLLECEKRIDDPGDAGTIRVDRNFGVVALQGTTGTQTRTMPDPEDLGVRCTIAVEAITSGTITVTFSSAYDEAGTTTKAFTATGQTMDLISVPQGARTYVWREVRSDGASGGGGAVTQVTSSSTGVTLNKMTGQITTVALTTAAGAEERFTVTNSAVAATDVVALATTYNGNGTAMLSVQKVAAGAFDVVITNVHASAAFNAVMVINFVVLKGYST